jgi:CRP/FNR family transcriptional regulator, cyclic AMP receptor protein
MAVPPEVLQDIPFLAGVRGREAKVLADSMRERSVAAGDDIVTQGTGGIAFFLLIEGEATVLVDGGERRVLGPGDHFGEIALVIDDVARTATVTAKTDCRVASLTSWNFKSFVRDHPDVAWSLLETLARRVADTPGA